MATNHTTNYQLCQWEAADQVLRADFNEDKQKIDAAMKGIQDTVPVILFGTYTGDGAGSRLIDLGRTPKAVYVCQPFGQVYEPDGADRLYGGLAITGSPAVFGSSTVLQIEEGGFRVYYASSSTHIVYSNHEGTVYHYIAFC